MTTSSSQSDVGTQHLREVLYGAYRSSFKAVAMAAPEPLTKAQTAALDRFCRPLLAGIPQTASILDLGCGDGTLLAYLKTIGFTQAQGVDYSAEQVAAACARGVIARQGDLFEALASAQKTYDVIFAFDVIEHMTKGELARLGKQLRLAIRPGGLLVLQTPNGDGVGSGHVVYGDLTHETIFNDSSLAQYLRAFGFTDVRFYETGPVPHSLFGMTRWVGWKAIRAIAQGLSLVQTGRCPRILTAVLIASCRAP